MINKIRKNIDDLDLRILELLNRRMEEVSKIGKLKSKTKMEIFAPEREKEIISRLMEKNKGILPHDALKNIYAEIINTSRSFQKNINIAYFGPEATFTHLAAIKSFGKYADYIPVKSIADVFDEVEKERADYGVVPIENSTEGIVNHTLDMFITSENKICSELLLEISHYLLSKEENLKNIKKIYSHSQAIAQCRNWIEDNLPNAKLIEVSSTASAAQLAKKEKHTAAIASEVASQLYGLRIIAKKIEDTKSNITRFLVIGRTFPSRSGNDKTAIMFSVKDRVGALHDMLVPFKKNNVNLTKIESRPTKRKAWEYIFFVDFVGHVDDKNVKKALSELEKKCTFLKILGSYPVGE